MDHFNSIFRVASSPPARAKFLSRIFAIFSEELVALWANDSRASYENLGRPTMGTAASPKRHTLDFTLRERATGKVFVAEMKCEIEYQNFRYLRLESVDQLTHHKKEAFEAFLGAAMRPADTVVAVCKRAIAIDGAILIWGATTASGREEVMQSKGLHDVLSVEDICRQLSTWEHKEYRQLLEERSKWTLELVAGLLAFPRDNTLLISAEGAKRA